MAIKNITAMFTKGKTPIPVESVPAKKAVKKAAAKKTAPKKAVVKKAAAAKKTPASTPKKVSTKKAVKKATSPKRLVVASDSESFWVHDGQVLNSLIALEQALKSMKPSVYNYHLTEGSSHFADWVETVLADAVAAEALRQSRTAKAAYTVISVHLKKYAE